jgi:hypothetical protein
MEGSMQDRCLGGGQGRPRLNRPTRRLVSMQARSLRLVAARPGGGPVCAWHRSADRADLVLGFGVGMRDPDGNAHTEARSRLTDLYDDAHKSERPSGPMSPGAT